MDGMGDDLTAGLRQLADMPVPAALCMMDGAVLAGVARRREAGLRRRAMLACGALALVLGFAGARGFAPPQGGSDSGPAIALLGAPPPLAPSALLSTGDI
jgi:hypothetical protein